MPANMAMYIIMNESLGMTAGKLAAQAGHAAHLAYKLSCRPDDQEPGWFCESNDVRLWEKGGHYAKIVLGTRDDLQTVERYLNDRGFKTALVIDEGRTEFGGQLTPTAIGVQVVDKNNPHVQATFGEFKLYRDPLAVTTIIEDAKERPQRSWWRRIWDPTPTPLE